MRVPLDVTAPNSAAPTSDAHEGVLILTPREAAGSESVGVGFQPDLFCCLTLECRAVNNHWTEYRIGDTCLSIWSGGKEAHSGGTSEDTTSSARRWFGHRSDRPKG